MSLNVQKKQTAYQKRQTRKRELILRAEERNIAKCKNIIEEAKNHEISAISDVSWFEMRQGASSSEEPDVAFVFSKISSDRREKVDFFQFIEVVSAILFLDCVAVLIVPVFRIGDLYQRRFNTFIIGTVPGFPQDDQHIAILLARSDDELTDFSEVRKKLVDVVASSTPSEFLSNLIKVFSEEGDLIADLFADDGIIAVAARDKNRKILIKVKDLETENRILKMINFSNSFYRQQPSEQKGKE